MDKIICTAVDGVSMTREHNLSCKYIMKEPCLLFPPMFSHTEQTTQPLVMHSFVTSNLLPLGYEAQHRMSEQKRRREGGRESVLYLENDKKFIYLWIKKTERGENRFFSEVEGRKKREREPSLESRKVTANSWSLTSL